jgi:hypothetical protein
VHDRTRSKWKPRRNLLLMSYFKQLTFSAEKTADMHCTEIYSFDIFWSLIWLFSKKKLNSILYKTHKCWWCRIPGSAIGDFESTSCSAARGLVFVRWEKLFRSLFRATLCCSFQDNCHRLQIIVDFLADFIKKWGRLGSHDVRLDNGQTERSKGIF